MTPGVLAAIGAIAGLAQAGGAGMSAYGANKDAKRNNRMQARFHEDDMEQREEDRKLSRARLGVEMDQVNQQRPTNALSFLSGLQDFSEKRAKSGSYLETVRNLARR